MDAQTAAQPPTPAQPASPSVRKGALGSRWVLFGLLALFCAMVGGFYLGYRLLVFYERRAALHLPQGTDAVARLDLEQVVLFEPFRQHILGSAKRWVSAAEWTDLGDRLGINFGMDLREVLVAVETTGPGASEGRAVVVIAGLFPKTGVLENFAGWLKDHGHDVCHSEGKRLSCPSRGLIAEQAEDGSIVIAPNLKVLGEALPVSERYEALGLQPGNGAIEFGWRPATPGAPAGVSMPSWLPGANFLSEFAAVDGRVLLETDALLQIRLSTAPGIDVQRLQRSTESMRQTFQALLALSGPEVVGEKTLLAGATVGIDPKNADKVLVQSVWQRRDIDRAAQALGDLLWSWGERSKSAP